MTSSSPRPSCHVPVLGVIQARMSSTRLPGKVLLQVCGKPMLQHQIERLQRCTRMDALVVATSDHPEDQPVEDLCRALGIDVFRGSLDDVLDRMVRAARPYSPDWTVRLTGDCPLTDPEVIDRVIRTCIDADADYGTNALTPSFPDGLDAECIRFSVMEQAWREASLPSQREHVTPFVHGQPQRFRIRELISPEDLSGLRWTLDEPADFVFVSQVFEHLYPRKPGFGMADVLALLRLHPGLAALNGGILRNEGYAKSLAADPVGRPAP